MKLKTFLNGIALFIGLGLIAYSQFNKNSQQATKTIEPAAVEKQQKYEKWQLSLLQRNKIK